VLRVVLDTNVIVSGLIHPDGCPGRILGGLLDGAFTLVLSPPLVDGLRRILRRPRTRKYIRLSEDELNGRLAQLETIGDPTEGELDVQVSLRDPDDIIVLIAAVEGGADCIVTGDDDLLELAEYEGVAIITPQAFLEFLTRG
jgi:hypothetical protein